MADPGQPQIKAARLIKAGKHPDEMHQHRRHQHPDRPKDQEQFGRYNHVDDEETERHACKHLRPRQGDEQWVTGK